MSFPRIFRRSSALIVGLSVFIYMVLSQTQVFAASRNALRDTISNCLDSTALDYCNVCATPRIDSACPGQTDCTARLEIWAETNNYVALRGRKMCDCPEGFVHGLVLPKTSVTGVEDPKRPSGIWTFAWKIAQKYIANDLDKALVVNPAKHRSQDQLHVHIVRLKNDARQRLAKLPQSLIVSLDQVWIVAREMAQAQHLADYGVLVTAHPDRGYLVLIDQENMEKLYTEATCNKSP
ncbi:MAG: CDP-diacylglycerol diphosphatase [Desulfuromonadales bacterium]|nr:CDP-diacylglycerol diphosphatase [Desulfuromonadales bacterium]